MLLGSMAIWIMTFPVLLYFYYEIPAYSIFLNIMVLPLLSTVVVLSLFAGIFGLFYMPLAQYLLCPVHWILKFYEIVCRFFEQLPGSAQIFGCPVIWKIVLYYGMVFTAIFLFQNDILYSEQIPVLKKKITSVSFALSCLLLMQKPPVTGLKVTMLDVGQGDGIFLQSEGHLNILIDGGSTDTNEVGKYRIIPYLKYYGIRTIDYMIMTHSDEDHVSGQLELLESAPSSGIQINRYLMPAPDKNCIDKNYIRLQKAAEKAHIPVETIQTGDRIVSGKLSLLCLHPEKGYAAESANAYSTTLSLIYGKNSMLLTGDLEGDGEETFLQKIKQKQFLLPKQYDILKVAHHGSKNSTSEEYLSVVSPAISLISCGKNNRYGHPHKDLLERLYAIHTRIYQTPERGAIFLQSDGNTWTVKQYLS